MNLTHPSEISPQTMVPLIGKIECRFWYAIGFSLFSNQTLSQSVRQSDEIQTFIPFFCYHNIEGGGGGHIGFDSSIVIHNNEEYQTDQLVNLTQELVQIGVFRIYEKTLHFVLLRGTFLYEST